MYPVVILLRKSVVFFFTLPLIKSGLAVRFGSIFSIKRFVRPFPFSVLMLLCASNVFVRFFGRFSMGITYSLVQSTRWPLCGF